MPIYEYECSKCGHGDTDMESINAPRTKRCPKCGKRSFTRLISASSFHLKGGGWYETDFKDKGKEKSKVEEGLEKSSTSKGESESKPAEKSESKSEKKSESKKTSSKKEK